MNDDHFRPLTTRAKLFGTCAAVADRTGLDPTLLRVAAVLLLCWAFKLTLAVYCIGALAVRLDRR